MSEDVRKAEKGGNTVYLNIGAWYNPETGHIHLTLPRSGWFHTTVNGDEKSKRGHPNLYGKLARALKEAGVPAPDVGGTDDSDSVADPYDRARSQINAEIDAQGGMVGVKLNDDLWEEFVRRGWITSEKWVFEGTNSVVGEFPAFDKRAAVYRDDELGRDWKVGRKP